MRYWILLSEKINQRTLRERFILLLVALALVYFIIQLVVISPLQEEKDALQLRFLAVQKSLGTYQAQETVFAQALSNDPNAGKKREIQRLQVRLENIDKNLETLATGLIAAERLPEVLHDVLNAKGKLNLLEMGTKAPGRLSLEPQYSAEASSQLDAEASSGQALEENHQQEGGRQENIGVFKHSVFISLEGSYFDVVSYLQSLERLPWKFYWEAIDYQVTKYPMATVVIEVYTLSTEAGILGV